VLYYWDTGSPNKVSFAQEDQVVHEQMTLDKKGEEEPLVGA
jgi:hypothetical protein